MKTIETLCKVCGNPFKGNPKYRMSFTRHRKQFKECKLPINTPGRINIYPNEEEAKRAKYD